MYSFELLRFLRWREGGQLNQIIAAIMVYVHTLKMALLLFAISWYIKFPTVFQICFLSSKPLAQMGPIGNADVTFPTVIVGMVVGWVSPALPQLQDPTGPLGEAISQYYSGWLASSTFLVAFPTMLVAGLLADKVGRKPCMLLASFSFILCWLSMVVWLKSEMIVTGRAISGIGTAMCYVVTPIYVKEISDDNIRGALCSMLILAQNLGFVFMYVIGDLLSFKTVLWISLAAPIVHVVAFLSMPETPAYLVKKKKLKEATEVLAWLRSSDITDKTVIEEINKLDSEQNSEKQVGDIAPWKQILTDRTTLKAFGICATILLVQECCGYLILLTYASDVFAEANVGSTLTPNEQAIVLGCVQVVGSVFASCMVERTGRKPLLAIMSFTTGLGMAVLGSWFFARSKDLTVPGWLPIIAMCLSIFSTAAGFQPIPFVVLPEMFTFQLRGLVSSLTVSLTAMADFVQTVTYQPVTTALGRHGTFWLFAGVCFFGTAFTVALVPETKDRSVQEIYKRLGGKRKEVSQL